MKSTSSSNKKKNKKKKSKKQQLKVKIKLFDGDRIFDTLFSYITSTPRVRLCLAHVAFNGVQATCERGMLVAHYTEQSAATNDDKAPQELFHLRSPEQLAASLEFWPHSRLRRECPQYAKGRLNGTAPPSRGRHSAPLGDFFAHDPDWEYAVKNHRWPAEALFLLFCVQGERGSPLDYINMNAFGLPLMLTKEGRQELMPLDADAQSLFDMIGFDHTKNLITTTTGFGIAAQSYHPYESGQSELSHDAEVNARACECCQKVELSESDCARKELVLHGYEPGEKFKKCGGCRLVWYCSPTCQKKHWKAHKKECKRNRGASEK